MQKTMQIGKGSLLFLILILLLPSCEETIDCENILFTNIVKGTFYESPGIALARAFDSVKVVGAPSDSVLYNITDEQADYDFPLNYQSTITDIIFYDSTGTDTLRFEYSTQIEFFGEDCGTEIEFSEFSVIRSTFDSLVVINQQLSQLTETNIEIYD